MVKGMRIEWNLSQMPVTRGAEKSPLRSYPGRSPDLQIIASAAFPSTESVRSGII